MTSVKYNILSDYPATYFRHKGIKVNIKDIEAAIDEVDYIIKSAVLFIEDKEGNRRLVAYIKSSGVFNQSDITDLLAGKLETYMIPAVWICIDNFPLTASGDIDRKSLERFERHNIPAVEFVAPQNESQKTLARIVQEILKIDSIGINDNFLSLGGSSLHALRIIAALRKQLHIDVDIKYFFIYPTIAGLAKYLNSTDFITGAIDSDSDKQRFVTGSKFKNTSIVPIKEGGGKMPLYIVCGGGGTVFTFEKFACMLDEDQPVYGFQQPSSLQEVESFPNTIEGIAEKYVNEILTVNPDGPYALSGHCIGGAIALEMARKLQSLGKKIQLLAMFDVILPKEQDEEQKHANNFFQFTEHIKKACKQIWKKIQFETFLLTRFPLGVLDYRTEKLMFALNKVFHFLKEDVDFTVFKKFEQKFEEANAQYKVKYFPGNIIVFYAKDLYEFFDKDKNIYYKKHTLPEDIKELWASYARDVKMYDVEGSHITMFDPANARNFVDLLQQHLKVPTSFITKDKASKSMV